jgi:prolyl oligopeptidase
LHSVSNARVLVDPNKIDPTGNTAIDWYVASADGNLVAVSMSRGGTEVGDVHVFKTETGEKVYEVVPRVNTGTAGGDLAWMPDGSGFFYTRHPREGERPSEDLGFFQQIYFHELGTPTADDRYELGKDFPRVAEIQFVMDDDSGTLLATVQKGDGGEFSHFLRSPAGEWKQISDFPDRIIQATFGSNEDLYVVSRAGAPLGKVIRVPLSDPDLRRAETVIPEGKDNIVTSFGGWGAGITITDTRLYLSYQLGGPSDLRVFDLNGKRLPDPKQLPVSSVNEIVPLDGDDVLFSNVSYLVPSAFYHFGAESGETEKTELATPSPVDFSNVEVVREFTTSKDGTQIPLSILFPKGTKRDGKNPTLAYGYGGYGISMVPTFSAVRSVLFDHGFVYAVANIRGGGEYGDSWHLQGNLTQKQNVFDDFAAALHHLIDRGYTSPDKLAIEGASNGGLLMGATLTQHPDLMRAVVAHVGIYDMLRVELSPNGVFNIPEFGTVKDADQFRALYAYSPFHNVKDKQRYPAVLFLTGANDPRVDALQSRKMTARLQAANASDEPILLRTSSNTGHGGDTPLSERIEQTVDVYSFLFHCLGISADAKKG